MPLVPHCFLFRVTHPCHYIKKMPRAHADDLLALAPDCLIDNFAAMDEKHNFADVYLAWNELGLGLQVDVRGKENIPQGDAARPRASDGVTLWLDTRDARAGHRASRTCHQFHLLASGGGPDRDEPTFVQTKINRALEDAPLRRPVACPSKSKPARTAIASKPFCPNQFSTATIPKSIPASASFTPSGMTNWASKS